MIFWLCLALILAAEIIAIIAAVLTASDTPAFVMLPVVPLTLVVAFVLHGKLDRVSMQARKLSPEAITGQKVHTPHPMPPLELSRSIIERAVEIRRALKESPSEVQIEMCALGYRACANDMITLTHLINEELAAAGSLRRLRLRRCRKRATDALSTARNALPPGALRATRQEQQ